MDPNFVGDIPVRSPQEDMWHREMQRKSQDTIRVYNPTEEDFNILWHPNLRFRVPNKGTADVPRYIAEKYCRDMHVLLVNKMGEEKAVDMMTARKNSGKPDFEDKWAENKDIWDKVPRTNDETLLKKNYAQLWIGLVNEFGVDMTVPQANPVLDIRSQEEKLLDDLRTRKVSDSPPLEPVIDTPPTAINPTFSCPTCGNTFKNQLGLTGHSRTHKKELEKAVTDVR